MPQSLRGFGPPQNEAQTRAGIEATTPEWDGWLSQDGESHPNSIQALQALTGGGMRANDPLTLASLRRQSLEERSTPGEGGIGGFGPSPQFQAQVYRDLAQDPITGSEEHDRIKGIEAQQAAEQHYNSPFETARRHEATNSALTRLILPLQVKGGYDVAAAQAKANNAEETQRRGFEQQSALQGQRDDSLVARAEASREGSALQKEQELLRTGKTHAKGPGGFGGMFTSQSSLDQARIAEIDQLLKGGGPGGAMPAPSAAPALAPSGSSGGTVTMITPQGRRISVPERDVAALEAHGARRH